MPRYEFTVTRRHRSVERAYVEIVADNPELAAEALEDHLDNDSADDPEGLPIEWEEIGSYYNDSTFEVSDPTEVKEQVRRQHG